MKMVEIYGRKYSLTAERERRILKSMIETQDKLDKELGYSEDLQDTEMIAFYRGHIDKLAAMNE